MEQGSMVNSGCGRTVLCWGNGFRVHVMAMWVEHILRTFIHFSTSTKYAKYILQPLTCACLTPCTLAALMNLINQVKWTGLCWVNKVQVNLVEYYAPKQRALWLSLQTALPTSSSSAGQKTQPINSRDEWGLRSMDWWWQAKQALIYYTHLYSHCLKLLPDFCSVNHGRDQ